MTTTTIKPTKANATKIIGVAMRNAGVSDPVLKARLSARMVAKLQKRSMTAARADRTAALMVDTWTAPRKAQTEQA